MGCPAKPLRVRVTGTGKRREAAVVVREEDGRGASEDCRSSSIATSNKDATSSSWQYY